MIKVIIVNKRNGILLIYLWPDLECYCFILFLYVSVSKLSRFSLEISSKVK